MANHVSRQLIGGLFGILGVVLVTFLIVHLAPGDPASIMLSVGAPADNVRQLQKELGLDRPLPVQFGIYVKRLVQGDLGISIFSGVRVWDLVKERLPLTFALATGGFFLSLLLGIPAGIVAAAHRDTVLDYGTMMGALVGLSTPGYWNGLLLIVLFAVTLRWFPVSDVPPLSQGLLPYLHHMTLPWIALSAPSLGAIARLVRSGLLDELGSDYIRTARAKGISEQIVLYRHALRNALIPVITFSGLQVGTLMGGVVFTETVFSLPGLGRLVTEAIVKRDYPVVQGALIVISVVVISINLIADALYGLADPRIRYQ